MKRKRFGQIFVWNFHFFSIFLCFLSLFSTSEFFFLTIFNCVLTNQVHLRRSTSEKFVSVLTISSSNQNDPLRFSFFDGSSRSHFWGSSIETTFFPHFLHRVVTFLRFWNFLRILLMSFLRFFYHNLIFPSLFEPSCDIFEFLNFLMNGPDLNFEDPSSESHFSLTFWTELWHFWGFEFFDGWARSDF